MSLLLIVFIPILSFISYYYVQKRGLDYIVIHYRWLLVIVFVIPLSLVYDAFWYIRAFIIFKMSSSPAKHGEKVANVRAQVKQWISDGREPPMMCTARPSWQTMSFRRGKYKETMRGIHINLVDILQLDVDRQVVTVEPLCSMGQISSLLTPLGWALQVTPELDDLTVGGMINGFGIETTSHIYGLFKNLVVKMELVTADGDVVTCSEQENPDLFHAVPMSHGTLGFLVSAELRIMPIKPYVKLNYFPITGLTEICKRFEDESRNLANDFVECLMFSLDKGVVMTGHMTNQLEPGKVNNLGAFWKPWFYKHVETFLTQGRSGYEYIPIRQYYHRHSKSLFWEMEEIVPFGNHWLFRMLAGWSMPPKVSFLKLTQAEAVKKLYEQHHMDQDMLVPMSMLEQTLQYFHDNVRIYPIWLCPFTLPHQRGFLHPPTAADDQLYIDIGLYGSSPPEVNFQPKNTTRLLEEHVRGVNGYQMLYADCYQTREEFREMFDHTLYDEMRKKIGADTAFPQIYDKVKKSARY